VQAGAFHPENKQEHSKDTRAIEAAYLARGLAQRVETLRDGISALALIRPRELGEDEPVCVGALVDLADEDGDETSYLVAPVGGGEKLAAGAVAILVVTPQSPLGAAMVGRREGDSIEVELPAGKLVGEIVRVR